MASNDGVVRLVVDHIFSGRGIFVDSWSWPVPMYFHLSEVLVKEGDLIRAGQVIGKVGATGRATGPHLHWGMKVNGARVNPYTLLDLLFPKNPAVDLPVVTTGAAQPEVTPAAVGGDTR
ncbi:MAG: M23 family metallopeptidase [Nitrospira sp.]|nr:M23 family metallopeptidase [Nitrospira sp.]